MMHTQAYHTSQTDKLLNFCQHNQLVPESASSNDL